MGIDGAGFGRSSRHWRDKPKAESKPLFNSRIRRGKAIDSYGMARPILETYV
jgi:hypothetical protein